MYLPQPIISHQQLSPEPGKSQRCISEIRELVIAAGGPACCPQPWKGYLEQALTLIHQLELEISLTLLRCVCERTKKGQELDNKQAMGLSLLSRTRLARAQTTAAAACMRQPV